MTGTAITVALDHGAALARYGVRRRAFTAQVLRAFTTAVTSIRRPDQTAAEHSVTT